MSITDPAVPQAGRRGRLPVKPAGERFAIGWAHDYLAVPFTPPDYPVDVSGGLAAWGMFGNGPDPGNPPAFPDGLGDCGVAARYHIDMSTAIAAGVPVPAFTTGQVVDEYLAYDQGQDVGVNLADYLLWCYDRGYIKAFAPVDHTDKARVDWAVEHGYGLMVGVNLTDSDEADFNVREWGSEGHPVPSPDLGHAIVKVKADGAGKDVYVTWGSMQAATETWSSACVEEAWLVVTTDEQLAAFTPQLLADIIALHGTGGVPVPTPVAPPVPVPVDPPVPTPDPAPTPVEPPAPNPGVLRHLVQDVKRAVDAVEDFIDGK